MLARCQTRLTTVACLVASLLVLSSPAKAVAPELISMTSPTTVNGSATIFTPTVRLEPNPAPAVASVVLLLGGNGLLGLDGAGLPTSGTGNFLIRSANEFLTRGMNVVLLDSAPAFPTSMTYTNRLSALHRAAIQGAVNAAVGRWGLPVWIAGTSNGSISAVSAATDAAAAGGPMANLAGVVLTSSVTDLVLAGSSQANQDTFNSYRSQITKPALVMWHERDLCAVSSPVGSQGLYNAIPSTTKFAFPVTGGHAVLTDPCGALSWHGYAGVESTTVSGIVGFIQSISAPGSPIAASGPGVMVEQSMPAAAPPVPAVPPVATPPAATPSVGSPSTGTNGWGRSGRVH